MSEIKYTIREKLYSAGVLRNLMESAERVGNHLGDAHPGKAFDELGDAIAAARAILNTLEK